MITVIAVLLFVAACVAAVLLFVRLQRAERGRKAVQDKYGGIIDRDREIEQRDSAIKELEAKRRQLENEHAARTAELDDTYAKSKAALEVLQKELALLVSAGIADSSPPPREILLRIAADLVGRGAQAVLAGCTEVPLVLRAADLPVPLIEPMRIGARAAIRRAGARLRPR